MCGCYEQQQQQAAHQQMIIVRQQQQAAAAAAAPAQQQMLVVSTATNSHQQMQLLQQQQQTGQIRLSRGVASPATAPSPRQPSPGHFMSPRSALHTTLSGTVLSQPTPPASNPTPDQTITLAAQAQQPGYGLNLDLSGLGGTTLGRADGDVTPLTPQDQLSRYVEQL